MYFYINIKNMKRIKTFLSEKPSYVKCGVSKISKASGVSELTVSRFRKTEDYKNISKTYYAKFK